MNLGEILTRTRVEIIDDPYNDEYPGDNLWSDEELTNHANWAVKEACRRAHLIFDKETADVAVYTLGAGLFSASLAQSVLFVERAWFDGKLLPSTDEDQLEHCYGHYWENRTGSPQAYYLKNNTIALFPKPLDGGELTARVCRLPLADLSDSGDTPEINVSNHDALIHGIAAMAYLKKDSQTLDKKAAADHMALFELAFGKQVTEKTLNHQRNRVQKRAQFRTF